MLALEIVTTLHRHQGIIEQYYGLLSKRNVQLRLNKDSISNKVELHELVDIQPFLTNKNKNFYEVQGFIFQYHEKTDLY